MRLSLTVPVLALLAAAATAQERGEALFAERCAACHGPGGNGQISYIPLLAGQIPDYLAKQLHAFRAEDGLPPKRPDDLMGPIAESLAADDIPALAAYLAGQTRQPDTPRDGADLDLGRKIYLDGNPDHGLPACVTCHRPDGQGIRPDFPNLAGQHPDYIQRQLDGWMKVRGKPGKLMSLIVPLMQPDERKAVADYVAGLR